MIQLRKLQEHMTRQLELSEAQQHAAIFLWKRVRNALPRHPSQTVSPTHLFFCTCCWYFACFASPYMFVVVAILLHSVCLPKKLAMGYGISALL